MIVDDITYNETEGRYDSSIFTLEKNHEFSKAYRAKKRTFKTMYLRMGPQKSQLNENLRRIWT